MHTSLPRVSVVTPVYNGEEYLAECIESVLTQTYPNWDYTIVDNCSTDRSLEIAQSYAGKDARITVRRNARFVDVIESHNIAFRVISVDSAYCKAVAADDWLYPECLARLVDLAEANPNVGIVGSYYVNDNGISWGRLPVATRVFNGRDICRRFLLGEIDSFWLPTSVLYRSSLVRVGHAFFPGSAPSADLEACLNCLEVSDFGFVQQILAFERVHAATVSRQVRELRSFLLDRMRILAELGPRFLSKSEYERRREELASEYFRDVLVNAWINRKGREFWSLHHERLEELGYRMYGGRFARAVSMKMLDLLLNPKTTAEKVIRRIRRRVV